MAEQPVKNWIKMTKNHMMLPPVLPPALKNIWAAGKPVGEFNTASRSVMQKQNVIVNIHPINPDIVTAHLIALGPCMAAS
jgi:hypothetical protein